MAIRDPEGFGRYSAASNNARSIGGMGEDVLAILRGIETDCHSTVALVKSIRQVIAPRLTARVDAEPVVSEATDPELAARASSTWSLPSSLDRSERI